jgi:uncharacterized Zn finger protein
VAVALAFTEADIRQAAEGRSFEHGLGYLDQVADLEIARTQITATVYGTSTYRVCLAVGHDGLSGSCSCPHGRDGFFCKHCVAVGLCVLELGENLPRHIEAGQAERQALASWLESLSKEELLAELLDVLDDDRDLRRRFELRAATANLDAVTVRRAVMELIALPGRGYIEYSEALDYADSVCDAAAAIDGLVDAGGAADAIEIARAAIALVAEGDRHIDDSSGAVGDAEQELLAAHLRACEAAPPDPVSLGSYLAGLLLDEGHEFEPELGEYAGLLGDRGMATVRERAAAAHAGNPDSFRAKYLMASLATDGDDAMLPS